MPIAQIGAERPFRAGTGTTASVTTVAGIAAALACGGWARAEGNGGGVSDGLPGAGPDGFVMADSLRSAFGGA
ncbi:hypothetical protein GCM10010461_14440 [Microbacterium aurantiacum]